MSTDMEPVEAVAAEVMDPLTGEVIDVANEATDRLAELRDSLRELYRIAGDMRDAIDRELTARLDQEATRSTTIGGWRIETQAPAEWKTDEAGLRAALAPLVEDGVLSQAAVDKAVEPVTTFKARRQGLSALHGHANEIVQEIVHQYDRQVERAARRVTVKRVAS